MGVPSYQLTTNFSANGQLTTISLANCQLTTNFYLFIYQLTTNFWAKYQLTTHDFLDQLSVNCYPPISTL